MRADDVVVNIEEWRIKSQEHEEAAEHEEHIRRISKGRPVDQAAFLPRQDAGLHQRDGHGERREHHEAEHSRGPREADAPQQLVEDDGVDDAAQRTAARGDADGGGQLGGEIRAQNRDGGDEEAARADADAEGLGEQSLPEGVAQREHHLSENDEEGAADQEAAHVAHVVEGAGEEAEELHHESLDRADPGDGGGGLGEEVAGFVVCLVGSECVQDTPGVEEDEEAADDLQPRF